MTEQRYSMATRIVERRCESICAKSVVLFSQ
jgi:hypothetical protein